MQTAAIAYRSEQLEACEQDDLWTVRLANLEVRARYLDLALAELLGNSQEGHRAAARLLTKLEDVVEQQKTQASDDAPAEPRTRRPHARREASSSLLIRGFRVLLFAIVSSTAFMLTTWLVTLR
jgi:hypothetical protein